MLNHLTEDSIRDVLQIILSTAQNALNEDIEELLMVDCPRIVDCRLAIDDCRNCFSINNQQSSIINPEVNNHQSSILKMPVVLRKDLERIERKTTELAELFFGRKESTKYELLITNLNRNYLLIRNL